jgi:hypothetical protein
MKKIIIILISCTAIISCSSNNENTNAVPENLIGSWKIVGYYDDTINPDTGSNYYPYENGEQIEFNSDNTLYSFVTNNTIGTYTVSQDSIITLNYNSNAINPNSSYTNKITLLTNDYLELSALPDTGAIAATERYEKVTTP